MPKMEKEQLEICEICEYGVALDQSRQFKAVRNFFLETKNGPLSEVKSGSLVRLSTRLGQELFYAGRVIPTEISEIFEIVHPFRIVQGEEWMALEKGDTVKLEKEEAILFLREGKIKEKGD